MGPPKAPVTDTAFLACFAQYQGRRLSVYLRLAHPIKVVLSQERDWHLLQERQGTTSHSSLFTTHYFD